MNPKFGSSFVKVATPPAVEMTGAGEVRLSQLMVGDQPGVAVLVPSHCSMKTLVFGGKPLAVTVNDCGVPETPATVYGFPVGEVMLVDGSRRTGHQRESRKTDADERQHREDPSHEVCLLVVCCP